MRTGDGLLVRVRLAAGRLDLDRAAAIADSAARFGNGTIEISSRANLQLRGVSEATLPDLQRHLDGLGLLDADAFAESLRNIVASPLSDIDPGAIVDATPIVTALEARLAGDSFLHGLPPKFGFLIDAGGVLPLGDVEADIRFEAMRGEGGPRFVVTLAGADNVAACCAPQEVSDVAAALASTFLRCAGANESRRMRDLTASRGGTTVFEAAGLVSSALRSPLRRRAEPLEFLGVRDVGASFGVGAAPLLGRMIAADLHALTRVARSCSAVDIRFTPWRTLIVTGLAREGARELAAALGRDGFVLDRADPILAIVACSGAPACASAARPVQAEALALAASVPSGRGIVLHVSGCEKGCARGLAAPFTLVARQSGYDLVVDGKASDEPVRRGLSMGEIASALAPFAGRPN
jgi:precorrin-3B synthase